jgi:hypothetical protein
MTTTTTSEKGTYPRHFQPSDPPRRRAVRLADDASATLVVSHKQHRAVHETSMEAIKRIANSRSSIRSFLLGRCDMQFGKVSQQSSICCICIYF